MGSQTNVSWWAAQGELFGNCFLLVIGSNKQQLQNNLFGICLTKPTDGKFFRINVTPFLKEALVEKKNKPNTNFFIIFYLLSLHEYNSP